MTEPQTGGTPTLEGRDDAAQAALAGTPKTEGADAAATEQAQELERLRAEKDKWLAEKTNYEEARRRLAELETQGSGSTPPTAADPMLEQDMRDWQELAETNPAAARLLARQLATQEQKVQATQAEVRWYRELHAIPAEDQAEVERRARTLKVGPAWAYKDLKAERLDKTRQELEEQRRRLAEDEDRRKRGVVQTISTPAPPAMDGEFITPEQFRELSERALSDPKARARIADYDAGRLKIRSG